MRAGWVTSESRLRVALLAVVVGTLAGFGAVGFRLLIGLFRNLFFFGTLSLHYDANMHTAASVWGAGVILVPVLGALLVAFLVKDFALEARGAGVAEVMDAVYHERGVIRPAVALIKALAASLSLGSGASVGREGPIMQIGATVGSTVGQVIRMAEWERVTLIAGGAAGGIAATFNTPIGGVLFAVELVMTEISARTLVPVALATGTATLVGQTYFGDHPVFRLAQATQPVSLAPVSLFAAYAVLGLILGLVCVAFIRAVYAAEDLFDRMPGNYYTRHALGMLLVGVVMYLLMHYYGHYYVHGAGYATVRDLMTGALGASALLALLFALKLLVTAVTLGSGGSGGVFSPALFMGATVGAAYATALNHLVPGHLDPAVMAAAGMGGVVGAVTGAAVTAMVMVFEMIRDYHVITPLLITTSLAYGLRRLLMEESVYTLKLIRRGHFLPELRTASPFLRQPAAKAADTPVRRLSAAQWSAGVPAREPDRAPHLLIVDHGRVRAVVPAEELAALWAGRASRFNAAHEDFVVVGAGEAVTGVVAAVRRAGAAAALVTADGRLTQADEVLGVLSAAELARRSGLVPAMLGRAGARRP
ncbi:MAG TPA: chloride channel protein [Gammaproteobacteria bacterium]|nr:chloride channel protein [Gammaproteobacteria bacterium]